MPVKFAIRLLSPKNLVMPAMSQMSSLLKSWLVEVVLVDGSGVVGDFHGEVDHGLLF
jgi:hypothetical protein